MLSTQDSSEGVTPAAIEETRLHVTRVALTCGPIERLNCTSFEAADLQDNPVIYFVNGSN